jgi:hypothetical protein
MVYFICLANVDKNSPIKTQNREKSEYVQSQQISANSMAKTGMSNSGD